MHIRKQTLAGVAWNELKHNRKGSSCGKTHQVFASSRHLLKKLSLVKYILFYARYSKVIILHWKNVDMIKSQISKS